MILSNYRSKMNVLTVINTNKICQISRIFWSVNFAKTKWLWKQSPIKKMLFNWNFIKAWLQHMGFPVNFVFCEIWRTPSGLQLYWKEIPTQVFFCEYCKKFKNNDFEEHMQMAASTISHYVKSVQIRSYFWSVFSCIPTKYGDLLCKYPYWVRIQGNMYQK